MSEDGPVTQAAADAGLAYVSDQTAGISRRAAKGHGFNYVRPDGKPVTDEPTLERIRKLVIPPAWTDVWICPKANGHIQATGRDQRGRKQYRYHDRWRQARDSHKYDRMIDFGRALPRLRRRVEEDLDRRGLPRDKVLAAVVQVMERTLIRVGNEEYARQNKSFGLTTLRDRHVKVGAQKAIFEFRGKSGKLHSTSFNDRRLARVVKACQDLPGQRLFQYIDDDGVQRAVESADVNAYIREAMGEDFSAKDFRTWAGTVTAAKALMMADPCASATESKRATNTCVKAVAGVLGNTAAVARRAYIHPAVLEAFEEGNLEIRSGREDRGFELAVLRFLQGSRDADASKTQAATRAMSRAAPRPHRRNVTPTRKVRGAA